MLKKRTYDQITNSENNQEYPAPKRVKIEEKPNLVSKMRPRPSELTTEEPSKRSRTSTPTEILFNNKTAKALIQGNLNELPLWITQDNINAYDCYGKTPLVEAVICGGAREMRYLIGKGANPNQPSLLGEFPLNIAIQKHHKEAMYILLAHGAEVTATHYALAEGKSDLYDILNTSNTSRLKLS